MTSLAPSNGSATQRHRHAPEIILHRRSIAIPATVYIPAATRVLEYPKHPPSNPTSSTPLGTCIVKLAGVCHSRPESPSQCDPFSHVRRFQSPSQSEQNPTTGQRMPCMRKQ
ncbi:hypothetical protein IAQ61_006392 [Plenodomus lingam]|uniref:uncharacterized protein n=1 Tax=Leptosphaeria maculans TaxID=5022 RepID=UPI00332EF607|nr:hypothetical protein IAQ61_006392 [Plenodomus lingam]